jgi:predicted N-acetyltransferase YhbS
VRPRLDEIRLRTLTVEDVESAESLLVSAFGGAESRKADLRRFLRIQPDGGILATWDGQPVGMVGAVDFGPFVSIGMMAVDPRYQRRGIGRVLMESLLDSLDRRGCPMSILEASEAGARLYPKLGFIDEGETHQFRLGANPPSGQPPSARVSAVKAEEIPALEAFDAPIFGARRGKVFAAYLADFPERAFLARDQAGEIAGCLFAQRRRLGPWIARTPEVAEDLLRVALQLTHADSRRVLAPGCNPDVLVLLKRYGFEFVETHRRMRRGGEGLPGRRQFVFGLASYAIG